MLLSPSPRTLEGENEGKGEKEISEGEERRRWRESVGQVKQI